MLVLTRKYQEKIRIGDNITITVLRTKGKTVRLGIEAPADVPVLRGELAFERPLVETPMEEPSQTVAAGQPAMVGGSHSASRWDIEPPHRTDESRTASENSHVSLKRVPRGKVPDMLPQLVAGGGPLRAMMDRR
jgi:carbon storage regulator CsrA